jgi:hypothetical protein
MNTARKLLPPILFSALFSADINLAQAADLSIYKAIWRDARDQLVIKGLGEPGAQVNAYVANSNLPVGTATVDRRGIWRIREISPAFVPCEVNAVSGDQTINSVIARAPSDCLSADPEPEPAPENTPPVISGSPNTQVAEGQAYTFRPSASDADNDTLTFSITNRPSWASFNSSNGTLNGTPTEADVGSYSNIVITVSDGTDSASLSPLTLVVEASQTTPTTGSVSLSWVAPSTRADGSALALSELSGYRLYMGASADSLSPVLDMDDYTVTDHVMENLESGTYYFAITAYDQTGNESDLSNVVAKETM